MNVACPYHSDYTNWGSLAGHVRQMTISLVLARQSKVQSEYNRTKQDSKTCNNMHAFIITSSPWVFRGSGGNGLPWHTGRVLIVLDRSIRGISDCLPWHLCSLGGQCQVRYSHQWCLHFPLRSTHWLDGTHLTFSSGCRLSQPSLGSNSRPLDLYQFLHPP